MNSRANEKDYIKLDTLIDALIELAKLLEGKGIPLIVGGGLSLYIRTIFLTKKRSPRYPKKVLQRSTKDIDIFLTSDIIINPEKIMIIRDSLEVLGYKPKTRFFQFINEKENGKDVVIDILSAPPNPKDIEKTKISKPRIKPKGIERFHAYLVQEAIGLSIGIINVREVTNEIKFSNIYLPSSFIYIILKLHAFRDRISDDSKDNGRHHAYDIFATVTDMDQADWDNAKEHYNKEFNSDYVKTSQKIIKEYFSDVTQMGIIRLKENELYDRNKDEFINYISDFIRDLKELLGIKEN